MTCQRCGHLRESHYFGRCRATRAWDDWTQCDCPAFVPEQDEHALCKDEWHRCHDGGGAGEYARYIDGKCGL